ncbi:tyrosyl-tRNA synthetase [Fistulifera solaris]|uniref:Tyrosyl-tRNA synthetase n=1 Tax=Fistulifera solaris TaxID=1519565 RepID=A0A1Z5JYR8_FISSO|nr:tyrosyl-tRNA synthetase [Fistulifera solaris]|eukprot:GAX19154.1 tyrosyl-tRNA synthetase [Fistulifera solaris]
MTGASLCELTIAESILQKDVVLYLIAQTAALKSRSCCKFTVDKKKNSNVMQLSTTNATPAVTITQRNAILRALVTTALHGILDRAPLYLAGGMFAATISGANPPAALQRASLTAWMSVAASIRAGTPMDDSLQSHLITHSFLLPGSSVPSVADFDLAVALIEQKADVSATAVDRWMRACISILIEQAAQVEVPVPASLQTWLASASIPPSGWWFADGTESIETILAAKEVATTKQATKGKPQQQDEKKTVAKEANANKEKPAKAPKDETKTAKEKQTESSDGGEVDITALDIRVGQIVKVWNHPEADKLFCEEIDLGNGEVRQIASGLRPYYQDSDLLNARVLVLCNLKKRNLVGFPSHGMVLCASKDDGEKRSVELVIPPAEAPLGERVKFAGRTDVEPEPENKIAKKKIFETLAPDLKTNGDGQVVFKGALCSATGGLVKAINGMGNAQVS